MDKDQLKRIDSLFQILAEDEASRRGDQQALRSRALVLCKGDETMAAHLLEYAAAQRHDSDLPLPLTLPSPLPEKIGRHIVLGYLGDGGMGSVYKVRFEGERFSGPRALKLIHRLPEGEGAETFLARFRAEEQHLASLHHPNIIKILDDGTFEGRPYFVMEYVDGIHVDEFFSNRQLGLRERLAVCETICQAIHFAHLNKVCHKDLKPGNILVSPTGHVTVLDFGLASSTEPMTQSSIVGGTPVYVAPEIVKGSRATPQSDIYSLGILFEELLSDCDEFNDEGNAAASVLRAEIGKARSFRPQARHESAEALATSLQRISRTLAAKAPSIRRFLPAPRAKSTLLLLFVTASLFAVVAWKWDILWGHGSQPSPGGKEKAAEATRLPPPEKRPNEAPPKSVLSAIGKPTETSSPPTSKTPPETEQVTPLGPPTFTLAGRTYESPRADIHSALPTRFAKEITLKGKYRPRQRLSRLADLRLVVDHFQRQNHFGEYTDFRTVYMLDEQKGKLLDQFEMKVSPEPPSGSQGTLSSESLAYILEECTLLHFDRVTKRFSTAPSPEGCFKDRQTYLVLSEQGKLISTKNISDFGVKLNTYYEGGVCSMDGTRIQFAIPGEKCKIPDQYKSIDELYNNRTEKMLLLSNMSVLSFPESVSLGPEQFSEYGVVEVSRDGKYFIGKRQDKQFFAEFATGKIIATR